MLHIRRPCMLIFGVYRIPVYYDLRVIQVTTIMRNAHAVGAANRQRLSRRNRREGTARVVRVLTVFSRLRQYNK